VNRTTGGTPEERAYAAAQAAHKAAKAQHVIANLQLLPYVIAGVAAVGVVLFCAWTVLV
jgi:hypothetical protein